MKIFTARVSCAEPDRSEVIRYIEDWCMSHIGKKLPVTCIKDFAMIELWDDRAVRVVMNKGIPFEGPHE